MIIITFLMLSFSYLSKAKIDDKPGTIRLNTDTSAPIIIFDSSLMNTTDYVFSIHIYDAESNLTRLNSTGSNMKFLNSSDPTTFNVTWEYVNYTLFPPLLSKNRGDIPTPEDEANTAEVALVALVAEAAKLALVALTAKLALSALVANVALDA